MIFQSNRLQNHVSETSCYPRVRSFRHHPRCRPVESGKKKSETLVKRSTDKPAQGIHQLATHLLIKIVVLFTFAALAVTAVYSTLATRLLLLILLFLRQDWGVWSAEGRNFLKFNQIFALHSFDPPKHENFTTSQRRTKNSFARALLP